MKATKQSILPFQRAIIPSKIVLSEKLITEYVIDSIIPLCTVECSAFKALVKGLCEGAEVPSSKRLKLLILERYNKKVKNLMNELKNAEFCCITADIWSSRHRSFFGATVHWINKELKRESSVLGLSRFSGTHDFEKVTEMLVQMFEKFNISREKVTCVVTDNGSNFVKAFKEQGILPHLEGGDDSVETDLVELAAPLSTLPTHERCASHTLSLVATTDLDNANIVTPRGPDNFKRVFRATLAKCTSIWNAAGRSVKVAEEIKAILGRSLILPNATRWNSLFDAIQRVLESKDKIVDVMRVSGVQNFTSTELELLDEYIQALQPVAFALDKLQGEKSFYFGYKIPVILQTKKRLMQIVDLKKKFATPLAKALLAGLEKRFKHELELSLTECSSATFASISFPYFKLRWIPHERQDVLKAAFIAEAKLIGVPGSSNYQTAQNAASAEDKFFDFQELANSDQDFVNSIELECLQYFKDPSTDLRSLNSYPTVRQMFLKYNTALASSAPVERMFSYGGMILSPKRANLSDQMLNMLVFLKVKF